MIKKVILTIFSLLCLVIPTFADDSTMTLSNFTSVQTVSPDICSKLYQTSTEKLFYLTIAAINANNFKVDEIQSKTGYILFTAVGKQYLATIAKFSSASAILKISPVNNIYYFQPGIVLNMFKYIDLNVQYTPIEDIPEIK
ncbi:MAG: hypothetical protein LKG27_05430 [Clostridiaceae bacterium]|jgi:hypothetical protein|nr:hypothetical protein [Clostridiaceae bacterium]